MTTSKSFEFSLFSLIREAESMLLELIRSQDEGEAMRVGRTHLDGLLAECEKAELLPAGLLSRLRELADKRNRMLNPAPGVNESADSGIECWGKPVSDLRRFVSPSCG